VQSDGPAIVPGVVRGDSRELHLAPEQQGALIQVASQFNLLEMVGPNVSPEDGVSGYAWDHTQGAGLRCWRPALRPSTATALCC
jgi:hypothetical protein